MKQQSPKKSASIAAESAGMPDVPGAQALVRGLDVLLAIGSASEPPRFRVVPNRSGLVSGVDPLRLNQLNDQLEVEDFADESRR